MQILNGMQNQSISTRTETQYLTDTSRQAAHADPHCAWCNSTAVLELRRCCIVGAQAAKATW